MKACNNVAKSIFQLKNLSSMNLTQMSIKMFSFYLSTLRRCETLWSAREIASMALSAKQARHTETVFHVALSRIEHLLSEILGTGPSSNYRKFGWWIRAFMVSDHSCCIYMGEKIVNVFFIRKDEYYVHWPAKLISSYDLHSCALHRINEVCTFVRSRATA